MLENHYKYVLVGGGLASWSAADAIRQRDTQGSILLVGQEVNRPYHRPPLSKEYLRREKAHIDLRVESPSWFDQHHIDLRTGRRAAHLDSARNTVTLDDGLEVNFDKLLIATGAIARPLNVSGGNLPNVYSIRTVTDVDRLHHAIDQAKVAGQRHERGRGVAVVIGGGVLGVELAASLTQMGLSVDLIGGSSWLWRKFAGENVGKFVARYMENHGVRVLLDNRPLRLEGDGRVQRVVLSDNQSVACDFAIAAVGAIPNRELLHGTSIASEKAILVDTHCQSNLADIYAAGDCAAVFDPLFGKHRLIDHWDNACVTGAIAGANMAGEPLVYDAVNTFFSDVFDLSMSGWGEARFVDRRHIRGTVNLDAPDFMEIGVAADGRIAQILSVGHKGEDELLRDLVKRRISIVGNEEAIKDPSRPLNEFLR